MWEINVLDQVVSFTLSLGLGGIMCVVYDVLRAVRKTAFNGFWSFFLTDIFYWVFSAFIIFVFLMSRTNGEIRGYVLLGILLGFIIFRALISKILFVILCFIFDKIVYFKKLCNKIFYRFYMAFEAFVIKMWQYMLKNLKSIVKTLKKLLKINSKLLYTNDINASMENVVNETKT